MLKFDILLEKNMTEKGYMLWKKLEEKIPNIWDRLSSSSKKYHKRDNGEVSTIEGHTLEMLVACIKLLSVFDVNPKTKEADILLISVVLHDSCKYGLDNPLDRKHTDQQHDHIIGDLINLSRNTFLKYFSNDEVSLLEEITRFHSGRWSTDWKGDNISWKKLNEKTLFVHFLDMASARNLLKIGEI